MSISNGSGIRDPRFESLRIEIMRSDRSCHAASSQNRHLGFTGSDLSVFTDVEGWNSQAHGDLPRFVDSGSLTWRILRLRTDRNCADSSCVNWPCSSESDEVGGLGGCEGVGGVGSALPPRGCELEECLSVKGDWARKSHWLEEPPHLQQMCCRSLTIQVFAK